VASGEELLASGGGRGGSVASAPLPAVEASVAVTTGPVGTKPSAGGAGATGGVVPAAGAD